MIPHVKHDAHWHGVALTWAGVKDHNGTMQRDDEGFGMQEAWDRASAEYLARRGADVATVSYGNLAPGDDALGLLGDVRDKRVLDVGCGGGHNAVACALAGATVVGVDRSGTQLAAARHLAASYGVEITWQQGDGTGDIGAASPVFDLVLAIQVLPYVAEPGVLLQQVYQLLRPGGTLVVSLDHPTRNCFYDEELAELEPYPVRSYTEEALMRWQFAPDVPMQTWHRPLGAWFALLVEAGFQIEEIIECPAPEEVCDKLWPEDSPLAPLRLLPHTLILVGTRPTWHK